MPKKKAIERSKLAQALGFLRLTYKSDDDQSIYCMMDCHQAVSFNSIIAAGTVIEEDLNACPNIDLMLAAVEQCGEQFEIVQLSPEKLSVRSIEPDGVTDGKFAAYVPCTLTDLIWPVPDPPIQIIDDRLLVALRKVVPLLDVTADTVIEQSIQLNAGSCLATNRSVLMEAWHGFDLPSGLLLPKAIVTALHKSKKHLARFGFGRVTATFYFDDETWLRTQLFQDKWPNVQNHFNYAGCTRPVPPQLFEAAQVVAPFCTQFVYVKNGLISSHPFDVHGQGSSLRIPIGDGHRDRVYQIDDFSLIQKHVLRWDETMRADGTYFTGDNIRGLIYHKIPHDKHGYEDDIPF